MTRVLVAGVSTRAAAESAARAGFAVTAVDAFADLDQHPEVTALSVSRELDVPFSANRAARLATTIDADAIAYLSPFENHSRAIEMMSNGRDLWGNSPAVIRRVRDPFALSDALRRHGFEVPRLQGPAKAGHYESRRRPAKDGRYEEGRRAAKAEHGEGRRRPAKAAHDEGSPDPRNTDWLVKPLASGGGRGVKPWTRGATLPRRSILQQRIDGTPGSIVFVAARGSAAPIGFSRQLIGLDAFGASGFRYCGSIMSSIDDPQFEDEARLLDAARAMADVVANEFNLVGVNGIDFVARDGVPFAIEVNPRWSSSMELVERAHGFSVFAAHVTACTDGHLPSFDLVAARAHEAAAGKAIVVARRDVVVGDTRAWLADRDMRDVPHTGDRIRAGEPVCTVFAEAADAASCERRLIARAAHVDADLERWRDDSPAPVRRRRIAREVG